MTYQEWLKEMNKGRGTELQESKRLIKDAVARCSWKTRDALEPLLNDLDELFAGPAGEADPEDSSDLFFEQQAPEDRAPVSEYSYGFLTEDLGNEFVAMMNRFEPPLELLEKQGVPNAFFEIFNALGILDKTFPVTDFAKTWERDEAAKKDPDTFAAQIMAMNDMKEEASLKRFLEASVDISIWKGKSAFRGVMKDPGVRLRLIQDEAFDDLRRDMQSALDKYEVDHAKTFKQLSGEIAQIYRNDQKYADLELRMNALRAVAGEKEKDRAKWDDVRITVTEFTNKVRELQAAQMVKTPEKYQDELADSGVMPADLKTQSIHLIYNARPVFLDDFNNNNAKEPCYRRQDFDAHMKEIDIDGFSFGDSPLTDDEFGSLSFLAVIDPKLLGSFIAVDGRCIPVEDPDLDIAVMNFVPAVLGYGDDSIEKDGRTYYGPDDRVGISMEQCVAPAREKVRGALQAWNQGDKTVLGKILAEGVQLFVNDRLHSVDYNLTDLNSDDAILANMTKGAVDLLRRDKDLMQAAMDAGLKEETLTELEGICMANRIEKAAGEAKKRIKECAGGLRTLSAFEKEQCVTAIQRFDAMMKDIKQAERSWEESEEYKELDKKYEDELDELLNQAGGNFKNHPELKIKDLRNLYKKTHEQIKIMKRSGVFMTLGKKGPAGLDQMLPENRLDPKAAGKMSSIELAQKMGLAEQREIKTTAKELYDQLTKEYKAGQMNYTLYEARLRTMRVIAGGDKNAKIDLQSIDAVIEKRLEENEIKRKESLSPVESRIEAMLGTDAGVLPRRVRHINETYGLTPIINEESIKIEGESGGAYTKEQFAQLEPFQEGPEENHLRLNASKVISQEDFAALAAAATQTFPEIGGVYIPAKSRKPGQLNILSDPTLDDAANYRGFYIGDVDQGQGTARNSLGLYIGTTIAPARKKVEEALRSFRAGKGSPELLSKILGTGLHQFVNSTIVAETGSGKLNQDNLVECALIGRLAEIAEKNPALMNEAIKNKYMTQEDLEKAKGLGTLYRIAAGAALARQKLSASASGNEKLSPEDRKACVELMLREKLLGDSACRQALKNLPKEKTDAFYQQYMEMDVSTPEKDARATGKYNKLIRDNIGLPDYIRTLGVKGVNFAGEMLDNVMPNKDAFLNKSDAEILNALDAKSGSKDDPFMDKEYTKPVYREDEVLRRSLNEKKLEKSDPVKKI